MKSLVAIITAGLASTVSAQQLTPMAITAVCGPIAGITEGLETQFGERLSFISQTNETTLFTLWVNLETGTSTVLTMNSEGLGCIVASGNVSKFIPLKDQTESVRVDLIK